MPRLCWWFLRHLIEAPHVEDARGDAPQFHPPSPLYLLIWTPLLRRFQVKSSLRPSVKSGKASFLGMRSEPGNRVIGLLLLHRSHLLPKSFSLPSLFLLLLLLRYLRLPLFHPLFIRMALLLILCRPLLLRVHVLCFLTIGSHSPRRRLFQQFLSFCFVFAWCLGESGRCVVRFSSARCPYLVYCAGCPLCVFVVSLRLVSLIGLLRQ